MGIPKRYYIPSASKSEAMFAVNGAWAKSGILVSVVFETEHEFLGYIYGCVVFHGLVDVLTSDRALVCVGRVSEWMGGGWIWMWTYPEVRKGNRERQ